MSDLHATETQGKEGQKQNEANKHKTGERKQE